MTINPFVTLSWVPRGRALRWGDRLVPKPGAEEGNTRGIGAGGRGVCGTAVLAAATGPSLPLVESAAVSQRQVCVVPPPSPQTSGFWICSRVVGAFSLSSSSGFSP